MNEQTDKLHESYIKKFGTLKENQAIMTPESYLAMAANLLKEYKREYALMDGSEGIDTDKNIEELDTRSDKELKELKLEHKRINAGLKLQSDKLDYETELQSRIAAAKAELLMSELVPADLPRRWWQRKPRPNYAKKLMLRELAVEINDYYAGREQEIEELEGGNADIAELIMDNLPAPAGRRARRKYEEGIRKIAGYIEAMLRSAAAAQPEPEQPAAQTPPAHEERKPKPQRAGATVLPGQMAMDLPQGTG